MSGAPGRVLIVEDEVVIALLLESFVVEQGCDVVGVADDFEGAVELFAQESPDVALVDVSILGARDGVDVARAFKAQRELPLVFLTAYTDAATLTRLAEVSPFAVLSKPFDRTHLARVLAEAVAAASLR